MRVRISLIFLVICLGMSISSQAAKLVKLVLNNGSEYEGYIEAQGPGIYITFQAESFISFVQNQQLKNHYGNIYINIDTLDGTSMVPVSVLQESDGVSKIQCNVPQKLNIKPADVKEILAVDDYPTLVTGVDREYKLYTGEVYKGKYIKEIPGKTILLKDSSNNIHTINPNEYAVCRFVPRFNQVSMTEQTMLLDKVTTKSGKSYLGIIEETNYQDRANKDFFLYITLSDGSIQKIKIADIAKFQKQPNPKYSPIFIHNLEEGQMIVNDKYAESISLPDSYDKKLFTLLVPKDKTITVAPKGQTIKIKFEINPGKQIITKDQFVILRLKQVLMRRYKIESMEDYSLKADRFVFNKASNTGKYEYTIEGGFYDPTKAVPFVIFDIVNKKVVPVFIQR